VSEFLEILCIRDGQGRFCEFTRDLRRVQEFQNKNEKFKKKINKNFQKDKLFRQILATEQVRSTATARLNPLAV